MNAPTDDPQASLLDTLDDRELLDLIGTPDPQRHSPSQTHAAQHLSALPTATCLLDARPQESVPWLAEGLILDCEPTLLVGGGGAFKSTVMLAVAGAVAGGYPVLGTYEVTEPSPVFVISEEDGMAVVKNRLEALIDGMGWDRQLVLGSIHLLALEGVRLDDPRWQAHVRREGQRIGARLFCFDPLADLLGSSERDPDAARPVIQFWRQLNSDGAAVIVVHHLGKPKEGYRSIDQVRGASSWASAARAVYTLHAKDGKIQMTCEKLSRSTRPSAIVLSLDVTAAPENPATWISAHFRSIVSARSQQELTKSQRTALRAINDLRDSPVSWTQWVNHSRLRQSTLALARRRLLDLEYVRSENTGKERAGKPVCSYLITPAGVSALSDSTTPQQLHAASNGTEDLRLHDSTPPLGGASREEVEAPSRTSTGLASALGQSGGVPSI